jgi:hypothetical protein
MGHTVRFVGAGHQHVGLRSAADLRCLHVFSCAVASIRPALGDGDGVQITNPDVNGIFVVAKGDLGVFAATYFPSRGETVDQFTPQRCCRQMLLAAIGAPIDVEIVDVAPGAGEF